VVNRLYVAGYGWSGPEKSWAVPSLFTPCTHAQTDILHRKHADKTDS